ncbi:hypothetical protein J1P26_21915 [Neobacillus sp. MM2021_6]|uniref:hypothetical protein n=1 Tax=Bacillaceae TaxID=186817 RepID=UPI0014090C4D|nr:MULTISPECIES: hypothetical protein [Bacillaceae]MBO0962364.1 hypothetical protein [Neobacillus sp. MM2021_6]NHC20847.1 hypothetical protein [Bacillus sp. MM2020_4]
MQKAFEKIKAEMEKEKNSYVQVVGEFMLQQIEKYPEAAEQILAKDKSIMRSLEEMKKVASKKKVGNMAVLTPAEGFEVVLKYFGITEKPLAFDVPVAPPVPKPSALATDFDVKLDDFL